MKAQDGEIVDVGAPFDTGDVIIIGKHRRLVFVWNRAARWVIATEEGGIAYSSPVLAYDLAPDGRTATLVQKIAAYPNDFCEASPETPCICNTASGLLLLPSH